jgi:hypothetical protein
MADHRLAKSAERFFAHLNGTGNEELRHLEGLAVGFSEKVQLAIS